MRFLRAPATQLIQPLVERRADLFQSRDVLNRQTATAIQLVLDRPPASAAPTAAAGSSSKGRCHPRLAYSHGQGHTRKKHSLCRVTRCSGCGRPTCADHSVMQVCGACSARDDVIE